MNPKVEAYFNKASKWKVEMEELRRILLGCNLTEEMKWGKPCYTFQNSNVVLILGFKEYCALGFLRGSLLKDDKGLLMIAGENSQAMRQIRFTALHEITEKEILLKGYIREAVEVEKKGLKVDFIKSRRLIFPEEFQTRLDEVPGLKTAFEALTPGRQRAYNLYFAAPKQSSTRISRIEKCMVQILSGKGLND
jgi:uncharacterized protein YdeI (YjbR/CyaY-like superfamily)